ncbi:MAG: YesL family protein [Eubacterium sp.]|nr:YesL family protein [Eubacterium sp.]
MNFKNFNYESRISRFLTRIMELVLLNLVFLLTCVPIITIGASITALYAICLKMVRGEEGYVIRGYLKYFAANFRHGTVFFLAALFFYFLLYLVYTAAYVNGGALFSAYRVITWAMGLIYSMYFLFAFSLSAAFENTIRKTAANAFRLMVSHFPMVFAGWLMFAVSFFISFGIHAALMAYALLFWMLIGFSLLTLWSSVYLNRIFSRYMDGPQKD